MTNLIPNYIDIDYLTLKTRLQTLMSNSETFKDYNFEGSNISMLIELMSYLSELTTYYSNKIAKNVYIDTADLYQTVHSLVNGQGYRPKGYVSGEVGLTVYLSLNNVDIGDQVYVPAWFKIDTGLTTEDGENIIYSTTKSFTSTVTSNSPSGFEFDIQMKEGQYETLSFTPEDIINNKISLPFKNYDHSTYPFEDNQSINLYINGAPWTRVQNFFVDTSSTDNTDNYFELEYDKYERYNIKFSNLYNIPSDNDVIEVIIQQSIGENGTVAANTIIDFENTNTIPIIENQEIVLQDSSFIKNLTKDEDIIKEDITISNSEASLNAANPQPISTLKTNGKSNLSTQYRSVTSSDFNSHLNTHSDIVVSNSWGEKEQNPGNILEYNKIYISIIPSAWSSSTISVVNTIWNTETEGVSASVYYANEYNDSLKSEVLEYINNRKYPNIYEEFMLPELTFFAFDIGIKTKRMYNFTAVKEDVKAKLQYYFNVSNRQFNEIIDFKEVHNFILDESETSESNKFPQIKGINSLVIRDVLTYIPSLSEDQSYIYEDNDDNNFPMFTTTPHDSDFYNILRPIKLGFNQFPILSTNNCIFLNEG